MDKKQKLKYLADKLLKRKEHADALRDLGERYPDEASRIDNILAAFGPMKDVNEVRDHIVKFESVVSLIKRNIKNSKGYDNFPEPEYVKDKKRVFDIKHKVLSINQIDMEDLVEVNNIYKKHVNIQSILKGG